MPWKPGQSGCPGGKRSLAGKLASYVHASTREGLELVEFALEVMRDSSGAMGDRMDALKWLADRGYGKAREVVTIEAERQETNPTIIAAEQLAAVVGEPSPLN